MAISNVAKEQTIMKTQTNTNTNTLRSRYVAVTEHGDVKLADAHNGKFKRFKKMIAGYGDFVDPRNAGRKMILDKEWGERVVDNFKNGPITRVPVPVGHPQTSAELAERTKGWLIDLEARDDGLYGLIEIRKPDTAADIEDGVLVDTSVAFDEEYQDKKTGKIFHDVLKHVGLVNDPYIKGMTEFEPALADKHVATILFSETNGNETNKEEEPMDKVKNDRDFDVEVKFTQDGEEKTATVAAGAEIEVPSDRVETVNKQIADATKPEEKTEDKADKADDESSDAEKKEKELADREAALAKRERELADKEAEAQFEKLLSDGKVVPAQKDAYLALSSQSNTSVELADGAKKSVAVLLSEFLEKTPKGIFLDEKGVADGDKEADEDVELTDDEKSLTGFGVTEKELKETKKSLKGDE